MKEVLPQWLIFCFIKTSGSDIKNENILNRRSAEELQKATI